MEDDLSLHLQSVWQSSKIGFYCLNAAASAELVEIFFLWSVWLGQSGIDGVEGETVRKVKHSSVRIENPIPALYRGTEYFSLARTFRTTWGGGCKRGWLKL